MGVFVLSKANLPDGAKQPRGREKASGLVETFSCLLAFKTFFGRASQGKGVSAAQWAGTAELGNGSNVTSCSTQLLRRTSLAPNHLERRLLQRQSHKSADAVFRGSRVNC